LSWAERNRDRISRIMENNRPLKPLKDETYKISPSHHTAANLYILNHRLGQVLHTIPRARSQVTGAELKKLSRRPSFESLGRTGEKQPKEESRCMSSESFASSGSLKCSSSTASMDEQDKMQVQQVSAEEAEASAAPAVERYLGFVKEIIPPLPAPEYIIHDASSLKLRIPSPTQVTSTPMHTQPVQSYTYIAPPPRMHPAPIQAASMHPAPTPVHHAPPTVHAAPAPVVHPAPTPAPVVHPSPTPLHAMRLQAAPVQIGRMQTVPVSAAMEVTSSQGAEHVRKSSFLPPHLNVVPEEMFPTDATDDFLMNLVAEEDWAIGGGIDMDTNP